MEQKPSVGRIVQVNVSDMTTTNPLQIWKPLIVTDVHSDQCVSGVIFDAFGAGQIGAHPMTSLMPGEGPHQWRWPPRT